MILKNSQLLRLRTLLAISFLIGFTACETEVELNADYAETTVVYGLLNQNESTHLIRINRSFLGTGSAFDYVTIADSSQYDNVEAVIEEWINGAKVREWALQDTLLPNKDEGIFYVDNAKGYYFNASDLVEDASYRLNVHLNEGAKEVLAETPMVRDFSISPPFSFTPEIAWANSNSSQFNLYPAVTVEWTSSEFSRRYEVAFRFNYIEYYSPTDSLVKSLNWKVGTQVTDDFDGGEGMGLTVEGDLFYSYVAQNISEDASVLKRIPLNMDTYFTVAGDDLHTYMEVNEPINGVVQERPAYTNIDGGIGIFSSRFIKTVTKPLNKNSLKELCEGQYTGPLKFCSNLPAHQLESWYCP